MSGVTLASIPSPSTGVWDLGPIPLRAYALCIIAGIIIAVLIADRRLVARGGPKGAIYDVALFAVPFGIVGARLYHVITTPGPYFGEGGNLVNALKIWEGGLGIWGAIAGGALGAYIACRRIGLPFAVVADASAPGIVLAQAMGRLGNYFNQELFGRPTDLPWALEIDPGHPGTIPGELTYHPTFLYELLWCVGVAVVLIWADKKFQLGHGRVFALYAMLYVVGRSWIEYLRIDDAEHILGLRLNIWTSLLVFIAGLVYFLLVRGPRERLVTDDEGKVRVLGPTESAEPEIAAPKTADDTAAPKSDNHTE